jgi:AcrR family transcriptional regulator
MTESDSNHSDCSSRNYHHGDLRQKLIDVACAYLKNGSAHDLSLRSLARELDVSQTAPYRHFQSKNDLFAAIAVHGFELLRDAVGDAKNEIDNDPEQLLIQQGLAYINWAEQHPEMYQFLFNASLVNPEGQPEMQKAGEESFQVVLDTIETGVVQGIFLDEPVIELGALVWAFVHGTASLLIGKGDISRHSDCEDAGVGGILSIAKNRESNVVRVVQAIKA